MINWNKKGRIFCPSGHGFFKSHATRPIPYLRSDGTLRLFFSSRSGEDIPYPTFVDVDPEKPERLLAVNQHPMLPLGRPGTFDDSGITPVSIVRCLDGDRMYYVGWKRRRIGVSIEASIGLAHLSDDGNKLQKAYEGPILGQDINHPFMTAAPFVLFDGGRFRMWYCSGTEWRSAESGPEPLYTVFYAESDDGVMWRPYKKPIIEYKYDGEVISAPWVVKVQQKYYMWYSTRGYATRQTKNYTIGYAESFDGIAWTRMDECAGISRSSTGWDSEMVCYPAVFNYQGRAYMIYSGNGVGRGGIGYATADTLLV